MSRNETRVSTLSSLAHIVLKVLATQLGKRKTWEGAQIEKGEFRLSLFVVT